MNTALPYVAWAIAVASVAGSLFFSEVMFLPPCILCWYQRIAMYPLVFIIGAGILLRGQNLKAYSMPLCLVGLGLAIYHNLIYYGFVPESLTPCSEGVPCNATQIEWFGVITIPLLGLAAFAAIALCLLLYRSEEDISYEKRS